MKKILTFLAFCLLTTQVFGEATAWNPFKWKKDGGTYHKYRMIIKQGANMTITVSANGDTVYFAAAGAPASESTDFANWLKPFGDEDDTLRYSFDTLLAASGLTSKVIFAPS